MAKSKVLTAAEVGRLYKSSPEDTQKIITAVFMANYERPVNVLNAIYGNGKSHANIALQLVNDHDG